MKKEDLDKAQNLLKLIWGSTQIALMISDWSEACTKNLFKKIGEETDCMTQGFVDTYLQFGAFFQYLLNIKLFEKLEPNIYKDVSERVIEIFSSTFVKVFYKKTESSTPDALNAYANEINSFVHNMISWYVEQVMTPVNEKKNRFVISASLLSYSISRKLGLQGNKQLVEDVLKTVMEIVDTKKLDESITTLAN